MTIQDILNETKKEMQKTIEAFLQHLNQIRTGRANANMLSNVFVLAYGEMTPLNQTAQVSAPEPQLITVKPWDRSLIPAIISGINKADLGINPVPDAEVIRINIPPLTEDIRKDIVKKMYKEVENFKIRIRNERRNKIDQVKKSDEFSDDVFKGFEKDIQTLTDKFIKELDDLAKAKEKELLTI